MIGRKHEIKLIENYRNSKIAQLGIIYGRRRVGKSYLLKSFVKVKGDLYFEAIEGLSTEKQIEHFSAQLSKQLKVPQFKFNSWNEVFEYLSEVFKTGRRFVVFDELPWMAVEKTGLVSLIKYYWDNNWKENNNLTLVLCGSVANYMVKHVIHSKALHNRKTFEMKIDPLPANEAIDFFKNKKSSNEATQFLMTFGGIPKYLEQININKNFEQNINHLCFQKNGFFINEFETIFKEQFKSIKVYEKIIEKLSQGSCSKQALAKQLKQSAGGGFLEYLKNLERTDFIKNTKSVKIGRGSKEKTQKYEIWDEWLNFYFHFVRPHQKIISQNNQSGLFEKMTSKKIDIYWGLAFEKFCQKNLNLILDILEIDLGSVLNYGPYFKQQDRKSKNKGFQFDLVIEKTNQTLCFFEIKYTKNPIGLGITKEFNQKMESAKIPKNIRIEKYLISANGITSDLEKADYFNQVVTLEDFYKHQL